MCDTQVGLTEIPGKMRVVLLKEVRAEVKRLTRKAGVTQPGARAKGEGKGMASSEGIDGGMGLRRQ